MNTIYSILKNKTFLILGVLISLSSCVSYQTTSNDEQDGVYYDPAKHQRPVKVVEKDIEYAENQTNEPKIGDRYFDKDGNAPTYAKTETDTIVVYDDVPRNNNTIIIKRNNYDHLFGDNSGVDVNINYYGGLYNNWGWNNWGWNGWYGNSFGWGWNNWGWNGWYGNSFGWGWNGYYGGYYGGFYGHPYYGYGGYYNRYDGYGRRGGNVSSFNRNSGLNTNGGVRSRIANTEASSRGISTANTRSVNSRTINNPRIVNNERTVSDRTQPTNNERTVSDNTRTTPKRTVYVRQDRNGNRSVITEREANNSRVVRNNDNGTRVNNNTRNSSSNREYTPRSTQSNREYTPTRDNSTRESSPSRTYSPPSRDNGNSSGGSYGGGRSEGSSGGGRRR